MILIKFWMHISDEEQLKRFEARRDDPLKSWKLTDEDWRNRKKRKHYAAAIEEMLERTDTRGAPWHLVEGDSKRWARVKVIETVIASGSRRPRHLALAVRLARLASGALRAFLRARSFSRWRRAGARAGRGARRSASALRGSSGSVRRASREIHQPMTDEDDEQRAPRSGRACVRPTSWPQHVGGVGVAASAVGVGCAGRRQRPERAALRERGRGRREQDEAETGGAAIRRMRGREGTTPGAPVSAQRLPSEAHAAGQQPHRR